MARDQISKWCFLGLSLFYFVLLLFASGKSDHCAVCDDLFLSDLIRKLKCQALTLKRGIVMFSSLEQLPSLCCKREAIVYLFVIMNHSGDAVFAQKILDTFCRLQEQYHEICWCRTISAVDQFRNKNK